MPNSKKPFDKELLLIKFSHLLDDNNTGLPTLMSYMDEVRNLLESYSEIGVISVDMDSSSDFECIFGWEKFDEIIKRLSELLAEFVKDNLDEKSLLVIRDTDALEFLIFFPPVNPEGNERFLIYDKIEAVARDLSDFLGSKNCDMGTSSGSNISFHIGFSRIVYNPVLRTERSIFYGLSEAKRRVGEEARAESYRRKEILRGIIKRQEINTRYQPIVDIQESHLIGYEALSFGPVGTDFTNPEMLFVWAREAELALPLDRVCRHRAIANCCGWLGDHTLFINTTPFSLEDPEFISSEMLNMMKTEGISIEQLVIEITERSAIHNFSAFNTTLDKFRDTGFRFAVDDAGAGYASLNTIAEVKPEFLKFDMNMVHHIDRDLIKQELLAVVLSFAQKINATVVAEGIETEGEYKLLKSFGVHLGQGYYIARPVPATSENPPKFIMQDFIKE